MEDLLIQLVKHEPCIYDKTNKNYKDRAGVVKNIWVSVFEILGVSLKSKW